jgi:hypothetical protein
MITIDELIQKSDKETAFLVLLCRLFLQTATEDELIAFLDHNTIDENHFYYLVRENSMRPVISQVIQQFSVNINNDIKAQLSRDRKKIVINSLCHLNEADRLITLFTAKGIQLLPYKGFTFASEYYNDLSLRESNDIDFLVSKSDIPEVQKIIYAEGYNSPAKYHYCKPSYQFEHTPSLDVNNDTEQKRKIHLEFHYHILSQDFGMAIENAPLMKNPVLANINGKQVPAPSHEAVCKIILTHHGVDDIWLSLKYYLDAAMLCKKDGHFDWGNVFEFCTQYGFYTNACIGLNNMELLLGVKSPVVKSEVNGDLSAKVLGIFLLHDYYKDKYLKKIYLRIKTRDGYKWKAKMTWSLFMRFMRPKDLDFKLFNLPQLLYPLYYILKPLRVIYRLIIGPVLLGKKDNAVFR